MTAAIAASHQMLDQLVAITVTELARHRNAGGTDITFQTDLAQKFITVSRAHPAASSAIQSALAIYRLALAHEQTRHLAHQIALHEATLADLETLEGL